MPASISTVAIIKNGNGKIEVTESKDSFSLVYAICAAVKHFLELSDIL